MFQAAETRFGTLTKARKADPKKKFDCDNKKLLEEGYFPTILDLEKLQGGVSGAGEKHGV